MAEKNRLITEKDELVVSKDRLWREIDLKRRNRELELALRSALDSDEDGEERPVDNKGYDMLAELPCDELQKYETLDEDASEALQNIKADNRYISMHQQLLTPSSQEPALGSTERVTVDSRPPISVVLRPLIESDGANEPIYGQIAEWNASMIDSVMSSSSIFGSLGRFVTLSQNGARGCADRHFGSHSTFWTLENPEHFACKTCFNKKLPCVRPVGEHHWILLPLPPATRSPDTDWQDKAYYIRNHEENSQRFPGT
ncbi:hypothetical protein MBLNU13_g06272t1 [Cladosporium sp. NU13]